MHPLACLRCVTNWMKTAGDLRISACPLGDAIPPRTCDSAIFRYDKWYGLLLKSVILELLLEPGSHCVV